MTTTAKEDGNDKVRLKRVLSVVDATAIIVCTIIGAGIFVSPKAVLSYAGSPAAALAVWFAAGVICSVIGKALENLLKAIVTEKGSFPLSKRFGLR